MVFTNAGLASIKIVKSVLEEFMALSTLQAIAAKSQVFFVRVLEKIEALTLQANCSKSCLFWVLSF